MKEALRLAWVALHQIAEVSATDYEYQQWAVEAITAIKAALAQPEQEPVAWMSPSWIDPDTRGWQSDSFESIPIEGWLPIYTTPPQRTWVGLTDDEILKFRDIVPNTLGYDLIEFARAIEAKLRSKNTWAI
jgi:hypothetical protein